MTIAVGNIDNVLPGVWGDAENYPPGALLEASNVMLEGSHARSRYGLVPLLGITSVSGAWRTLGATPVTDGAMVVYSLQGGTSADAVRVVGRKGSNIYTDVASTPSGVYSVHAASGMVHPPGASPGVIVATPTTEAASTGHTPGAIARSSTRDSAWVYFDQPAQPGTYTFRVQYANNRTETIQVTFADPASITEVPVNMSGIPITIGAGDNMRANPEYQAIYNQRSTAAQAEAIRQRAAAVQALQPSQAALKVLQAFQAKSSHTQQPNQPTKLYCAIGGNDLLHLHNPVSCKVLEVPSWVTVLNPGVGTKENLPAIGHPGQFALLADGLRYRYTTEDGWVEVPGDEIKGGFQHWGWLLSKSGLNRAVTNLKFNLGRKSYHLLGIPQNAYQDGSRTVIHCEKGILVSTAVDPFLYGPVSRNSTSPADGWIYSQSSTIISAAPGGEGVYFSDDDGTVYLHRYGSGGATRLYKGPDCHLALYQSWLYMVSREGRVARLRRGADGEMDVQMIDHIRIGARIASCTSCAFGVLVTCNDKRTGYRIFYLIQSAGDSVSLWGPMQFPRGSYWPVPGGVVGYCTNIVSGESSVTTPGVEFCRWGFAGDELLDLDLQKKFTAPGTIATAAHLPGSLKMRSSTISSGVTRWGYWNPGTSGSTCWVGKPVDSYIDVLPPLPGHIQTPAEGITLHTFTVRDPHPGSFTVSITPLVRDAQDVPKEGKGRTWRPSDATGEHGPPVMREVTHTVTHRDLVAIRIRNPQQKYAPQVFRSGRYKYTVKVWGNRVTSAWSTGR